MHSTYDKENIANILAGEGDWFNAHLLRFIDKVIFRADKNNLYLLWRNWPEQCESIYKLYGWTDAEIAARKEWGYV